MTWRLAYSLNTLRNQVNVAYPNRSKASDGTIGDAAHRNGLSDHNPNAAQVVCALDLTHDPANGFNAHAVADVLVANRHPNLKYVISNRRIAGKWSNWQWQFYGGANWHDKHIHISVGVGGEGQSQQPYDDTTNWNIGGNMAADSLTKEEIMVIYNGFFDVTDAQVNQDLVKAYVGKPLGGLLNHLHRDPTWLKHREEINNPPGFKQVGSINNQPIYQKN